MPGDSGVLVVTRVLSTTTSAHEAAGAAGIRHSPRPLWARRYSNASGAPRRENEVVCRTLSMRDSVNVIASHRVGAKRRSMTGSGGRSRSAVWKLDHGLAGRHLLVMLVAHHDVDQDPARIRRDLFRFHDAGRL